MTTTDPHAPQAQPASTPHATRAAHASEPHTTDEAGLQALLTLSPDAVLVTDTEGVIRRANHGAEALFRTVGRGLEGRSIDLLLPQEYRAAHRQDRERFHADPVSRQMGSGRDLAALRSDGTRFPVDVCLQPVRYHGELLVVAVVRDLSTHAALRERNQQLQDHAEELQRFIDLASHELRTPLTGVRGFAETLLHGRHLGAEEQRMLLERIIRNAARQEALISGLLDLARIQRGAVQIHPTVVPLDELVAEVVGLFRLPGELHVDVPPLTVFVDQLRTEQVLGNLLTNAARYGEPPFGVSARPVQDRVILQVSDAGQGVDPSFEQTMFEAFQQESTGDDRGTDGLGLGLHLSQQLVEAMGGRLHYRRDADLITRFEVHLPRAAGDASAASA